ncbi:MAG: TetR/AcrR family transcriptional regulator [Sphingopyxis sp.]|nr:TetR/AcrR family transcriptional regulator [Sphingopyxis sp.]
MDWFKTLSEGEDTDLIETLSTRDWLDAARALLVRDGIDAVKIGRIAKECGVTRGGFYWRFKDRGELLGLLLDEWRQTNTAPLIATLRGPGTLAERFRAAASLWIEERDFDPRFDTAVRNWALVSPDVAAIVHQVDEERITAFADLFREAAYDADEALVRARIVYFHQIGYYALHIQETPQERMRLANIYFRVLTGFADF